jgi:hypothetical protein
MLSMRGTFASIIASKSRNVLASKAKSDAGATGHNQNFALPPPFVTWICGGSHGSLLFK